VTGREHLVARYRALVREELPAAARRDGWVLREDHCFGRVLLDDAAGGCWYDVLDRRRTAFLQLTDAQLAQAVALAERLPVEGDPLLREVDERSRAWRGKPPRGARRG
jgi:proline racemase